VSAWPLLRDLQRRVSPASTIVVVAARLDPDAFVGLDDLRLAGYLLWGEVSAEAVRHCLAAVIDGNVVIGSRQVARAFVETQCHLTRPRPEAPPLTEREQETLRCLAGGLAHREIAEAEGISPRTVDRIVAILHEKLDAPTEFMLGVKAAQLRLIP
jgi:DNA-binding NarL/FixJ family response regulator